MAHTLAMLHFPPADASVVSTDLVVKVDGVLEPTVGTHPSDTSFAIERQLDPGQKLEATITDFNADGAFSTSPGFVAIVPDLTPPPTRGPITATFAISG